MYLRQANDEGTNVTGQELFHFDGVDKFFYKNDVPFHVLRNIDLRIYQGEYVAIVGPSGCGKSTLLNMAAGLMPPNGGTVKYRGTPIKEVNHHMGYVTQRDNLLPWRNVQDNVAIGLEIRGENRAKIKRIVGEMIEKVGLTSFEKHYPTELSGGMRKRVTLARSMATDPETLAMDEPFGALDAQLKLVLQAELLKLWSGADKTCIFVTHDLAEAVALADRIVAVSARPGTILTIQEIDLPRPRDVFSVRFEPHFAELHQKLWDNLANDVLQGSEV
jgi:NitT/TauT family transport system ATP-binding protein